MNADLEATLGELGGDYREMVVRMKAAYEPMPSVRTNGPEERPHIRRGRILGWSAAYLVAASLLVVAGFAVVLRGGASAPKTNEFMLAHSKTAAAVDEMIRTQRPDGGWGNDFVTRQNIAALGASGRPEARLAMRKAMRNLRLRGVF